MMPISDLAGLTRVCYYSSAYDLLVCWNIASQQARRFGYLTNFNFSAISYSLVTISTVLLAGFDVAYL